MKKIKRIAGFKIEASDGVIFITRKIGNIFLYANKRYMYYPNAFVAFDDIKTKEDLKNFVALCNSYWVI